MNLNEKEGYDQNEGYIFKKKEGEETIQVTIF